MERQREINFSFWNKRWKQNYVEREQRIRANPMIDYWDKRARDFSLMRKSNDYDFGRNVYAALRGVLNPNATLLDIGTGPGSFTIPFAQQIKFVTAIEPSKGMAAVLKENAKEVGVENFTVIEELLEGLPQDPFPIFNLIWLRFLSSVSIIDYRCERTVADEIECRKLMYEQYEQDLNSEAEEKIRREVTAGAKDGMCLIVFRSAVIWWNPREVVSNV